MPVLTIACVIASTATALAQPRVEVVLEDVPYSIGAMSTTFDRALVLPTADALAQPIGYQWLDIATGVVRPFSLIGFLDDSTQLRENVQAVLLDGSDDLRTTLWSAPITSDTGRGIQSGRLWVFHEHAGWVQLDEGGGSISLPRVVPDGSAVVASQLRVSSAAATPEIVMVRWDLTTGAKTDVEVVPGFVVETNQHGDAAVLVGQLPGEPPRSSVWMWRANQGSTLITSSGLANATYSYAQLARNSNALVLRQEVHEDFVAWTSRSLRWTQDSGLRFLELPASARNADLFAIDAAAGRGLASITLSSMAGYDVVPAIWSLGGGFVPTSRVFARLGLSGAPDAGLFAISGDGKRAAWWTYRYTSDNVRYVSLSIATDVFCDGLDFNNDGVFPDAQDAEDFLAVLAGGPGACSAGVGICNDLDFNNDGVTPDDADLAAFLRRLGGGSCDE
jgi:hypothetical protein